MIFCLQRCALSAEASLFSYISRIIAAARCLQIVDRGYVLDQGTNAYTGTGRELANDPKVIELYLGTLAKA